MVAYVKQLLVSDWHAMRLVRLGFGLMVGFQAWQNMDGWLAILSGLFLLQAITNTGCCGSGGCAVSPKSRGQHPTQDIHFTEIKPEEKN